MLASPSLSLGLPYVTRDVDPLEPARRAAVARRDAEQAWERDRWLHAQFAGADAYGADGRSVEVAEAEDLLGDDSMWAEDVGRARPELWQPYYGFKPRELGLTYFASGSNHPGEIRGLAEAACNPGVAVQELTPRAVRSLTRLAGGPAQVFADSGAFSEFRTQHVIPPLEWERRLAIYADLAMALGRQLFCVAPDHVADQRATLARMECYAKPVQRLAGLGANVLLPVQGGEMSMAAFWRRQLAVMGAGAWIAGIPCCAAATTPEALAAFVREARPQRVHLLGVGPTGKTFPAYLAAVRACGVDVGLSCDSGRLRALVGRQSGVRPLTAERDRWVREGHEVDDVEGLKVLQFKCHLLEQQRRAYEAAFGPQDLGVVLPDGSAWRPRTAFNEEPSAGAEAFTKAELGYYAWRRVGEAASQAQKRVGGEVM